MAGAVRQLARENWIVSVRALNSNKRRLESPLFFSETNNCSLVSFLQLEPQTQPNIMSPTANNATPHILVFPYPAQGHMLPLLDLTHHLALRGATITIIITPKNLPFLDPLLSTHPKSIHTLLLPFPSHPAIPHGIENVKDIGNKGNPAIISALHSLSHPISLWFSSHPSPPIALLSDFFLGWTLHLASHLHIPRIAFYSSGAFLASILHHLWPNFHQITNITTTDETDQKLVSLPHLPYSPLFPCSHLPSALRLYNESDPIQVFVRESGIANASSWGFVLNSFDAVEVAFLDHVRREAGHARVWAVGPVSVLNSSGSTERGGPNSASASEVFDWLDGCTDDDHGSVLYVCFGSQVTLRREQVKALADGLERSGIKFILTVKSDDDLELVLRGFEGRVAGRGIVIRGWAPQVGILSHRAVGGFVTHCGWNSVLEGLVAGVMLLAWPMEADQFVNAKLLVEYLGVAVRICEGRNVIPNSDEFARCVAELMGGGGSQIRARAMKLREEALAAVKEGGSSARDLDGLMEALRELHLKRKNGVPE